MAITKGGKTDLPPKGDRNPDPISDQSGAHPIETGIGAAAGGLATGAAVGMVAGPVGAAIGAAVGAVVGGLAGKGVGEYIDPTVDDDYLESNFAKRPYVRKGDTFDTYRPAYQYGGKVESKYVGKRWDEVEDDVRSGWEQSKDAKTIGWDRARDAVRDAYDRTMQLREERLDVSKKRFSKGDAHVRKEVITETKNIDVPVEREELVIERRPASGRAAVGDLKAEEIRIPLTEERVDVSKHSVVTEEVSVGKRKVRDTHRVTATVGHEELRVEDETEGEACETPTRRKS